MCVLKESGNYRNHHPASGFLDRIYFDLFGGIDLSLPCLSEGEIPSKSGPPVFGRDALTLMHGGDNLIYRHATLTATLQSMRMQPYQPWQYTILRQRSFRQTGAGAARVGWR